MSKKKQDKRLEIYMGDPPQDFPQGISTYPVDLDKMLNEWFHGKADREKQDLEEKYGVIKDGYRIKPTEHICSVCKSIIEAIFVIRYQEPIVYGPGGKGYWSFKTHRCRSCNLVYDFT